jgi:hypothetical protein
MTRRLRAALLLLSLTTCGCGKIREISACRALAKEVNTSLDEIEALSKKQPVDELRIADRYAALAKSLEPRTKGDSTLATALVEYVSVLQATSTAVRSHAAVMKSGSGRGNESRRDLERLLRRERAAVTRIDVACER